MCVRKSIQQQQHQQKMILIDQWLIKQIIGLLAP